MLEVELARAGVLVVVGTTKAWMKSVRDRKKIKATAIAPLLKRKEEWRLIILTVLMLNISRTVRIDCECVQ